MAEENSKVKLDLNDSNHALRILRMTINSEIITCNGQQFSALNTCLNTLANTITKSEIEIKKLKVENALAESVSKPTNISRIKSK